MNFTTFREPRLFLLRASLVAVAGVAMLSAGWLADPYEPVRAIAIGLSLVGLGLLSDGVPRESAGQGAGHLGRIAAVAAIFYVGVSFVSAASNGFGSSLFGVHGRYEGLVSLAALVGLGFAGAALRPTQTAFYAWVLLGFGALQSSLIGVQLATGASPQGLLGNTVPAGSLLAIAGSVGVGLAALQSGRRRAIAIALAIVCAIGATATGSRGALIALIAGLFVAGAIYAMRSGRGRATANLAFLDRLRSGVRPVLALLLAAAVLVGLFASLGGGAKLSPASLQSGSARSRWEIWMSASALAGDNVLLGVGPGRFIYEYPAYQSVEHALTELPDVRADQAHSLLLQSASERGLFAAVALACLYGMAVFAGVQGVRRRDGASALALAGFAAYVTQGAFGVHSLGVDSVGWLLGGVLIGRSSQAVGLRLARGLSARKPRLLSYVVAGIGIVVVVLSGLYGMADAAHQKSLELFQTADFARAWEEELRAIEMNPLVDVYRVGLADVATYGTDEQRRTALELLEDGLLIEPESYDLLVAKARLLRSAGAPTNQVADAYESARSAYPLGLTINIEAADALQAAGRTERAKDARDTAEMLLRDEVAPE